MPDTFKIEFATPDLKERFMEKFKNDPDVKKLEKKRLEYLSKNQYIQAMSLQAKINAAISRAFNTYMNEMLEEGRQIDLNKSDLPDSLKEELNILYVTTFMACDIIESCVLDMNDAIKKHDATLSIEIFDDIKELSKKAKEKLSFFQKNSGHLSTLVWGDKCDDMYAMCKNKAKKIIKTNKDK